MIVVWCTDPGQQERIRSVWRAHGIDFLLPTPVEFISMIGDPAMNAAVFVDGYQAGIGAYIPLDVALFTVGDDPVGNSICYPSVDAPGLLRALSEISGDRNTYTYKKLLRASHGEVTFLGEPMRLGAAQREILSLLVREHGKSVSLRELRVRCLGSAEIPLVCLYTAVRAINREARRIGGRRMILFDKDVPGGGYRLKEYF